MQNVTAQYIVSFTRNVQNWQTYSVREQISSCPGSRSGDYQGNFGGDDKYVLNLNHGNSCKTINLLKVTELSLSNG